MIKKIHTTKLPAKKIIMKTCSAPSPTRWRGAGGEAVHNYFFVVRNIFDTLQLFIKGVLQIKQVENSINAVACGLASIQVLKYWPG